MEAEIAREAWSPDRVDSRPVPIHDDASVALVTVAIGELVDLPTPARHRDVQTAN